MGTVQPSLAGPKRPQDKVLLSNVDENFNGELVAGYKKTGDSDVRVAVEGEDYTVGHGDVVIAAITSCTNTRSEEHTSELQSLMRISYAVFCLKKKKYKI